jgi:hypothetical protein
MKPLEIPKRYGVQGTHAGADECRCHFEEKFGECNVSDDGRGEEGTSQA